MPSVRRPGCLCVRSWPACPCVRHMKSASVNNLRGYRTSPSFTTGGKVKEYKMLSYAGAVSCIINGKPNYSFPREYNLDLHSFYAGSRRAIEIISNSISTRDLDGLSKLVDSECLNGLRMNVFEFLPPANLAPLAVRPGDIFFQYIESANIQAGTTRVDVVAYSLAQLAECKMVSDRMKTFQNNLRSKAAQNQGILQRDDMDSAEFRRLALDSENLNMDKLVRDGEILVSSYSFERSKDSSEWTVTRISHTDTKEIWSWLRRLIWKGRVHIAANYKTDFYTVLRYDYTFDIIFVCVLVYLQILAVYLGYKIEQEEERRRLLELAEQS